VLAARQGQQVVGNRESFGPSFLDYAKLLSHSLNAPDDVVGDNFEALCIVGD
jgi:hypothetical protein